MPLQALPQAQAAFAIYNSPLSEVATLGFEYGYNVQEPGRLVLWEAQYGDFINGAQPIVDEFIVSAREKWGQTPSLVLLLPHACEGAGPDHSSGRLERFLQLAAKTNLRIANCTTAAQYFHLLRRQALLLESDPLPLVVMTPKSLLRNPAVASRLDELVQGSWQPVIPDLEVQAPRPCAAWCCAAASSTIDLVGSEQRAQQQARRSRARRAALPLPAPQIWRTLCPLSRLAGDRLGTGSAQKHGGVGVHELAAAAPGRRPLADKLCGPPAQRQPRRRLAGRTPQEPIDDRRVRLPVAVRGGQEARPAGGREMPTNIVVPELGESVIEATVAQWLKQEGDRVTAGETVLALDTDKVTLEVAATQDGVLAHIQRQPGEPVKVGDVLGTIEDAGRQPPAQTSDGERAAAQRRTAVAVPSSRSLRRPRNV